MVECLLCKCKALNSSPVPPKRKKKKKKLQGEEREGTGVRREK
jgi:hypothetical protein